MAENGATLTAPCLFSFYTVHWSLRYTRGFKEEVSSFYSKHFIGPFNPGWGLSKWCWKWKSDFITRASLVFRLKFFAQKDIIDLGTIGHSNFPIWWRLCKFQVYTMTTSFIKMMISKSYTEYLQKWLLSISLEYCIRLFNSAPADNSVHSCIKKHC